MKKRLVIIGWILLAIAALVSVGIYMAPSVAEVMAFKRFPEEKQAQVRLEYREWRDKPIHLPPAALEAEPYTSQTLAAVKNFAQAWEKDRGRALKFTRPYQDGKLSFALDDVKPELEKLAPLNDAFVAVVERPDYEAILPTSMNRRTVSMLPMVDGMAFRACIKLLRLKAQAAMHEQHWPEAFRAAEQMARASRTHPYAYIIVQMISLSIRAQAINLWTTLVNECDDAGLLRRALDAQNALAGQMRYYGDPGVPLMAFEKISALRELKRCGMELDYQDKTGRQLTALELDAIARRWEESLHTDKRIVTPTQTLNRQKEINEYHEMAETLTAKGSSLKLPFVYMAIRPEFSGLRDEPRACIRKLDQLRRQTARKLYRLENGKEPANDADLVPRYLPSPVAVPVPTPTPKPDAK